MDRQKACRLLGLPEEAEREEIEARYFVLVKRYRHLEADERPDPGEPLFSAINGAYRFLIGFTPMQTVQFKTLSMREKLQHIREHYIMEITFSIAAAAVIIAISISVTDLYKAYQASQQVSTAAHVQHSD